MIALAISIVLQSALALDLGLPLSSEGFWALEGSASADSRQVTLASSDAFETGVLVSTSATDDLAWQLTIEADVSAALSDDQGGFSVWFSSNSPDISSSALFGVPAKLSGAAVIFDLKSSTVKAELFSEGRLLQSTYWPTCPFAPQGPVQLTFTAVQSQVSLSLKDGESETSLCLTVSSR
jgi:hypothetical protein